jgi:hypothetical protein
MPPDPHPSRSTRSETRRNSNTTTPSRTHQSQGVITALRLLQKRRSQKEKPIRSQATLRQKFLQKKKKRKQQEQLNALQQEMPRGKEKKPNQPSRLQIGKLDTTDNASAGFSKSPTRSARVHCLTTRAFRHIRVPGRCRRTAKSPHACRLIIDRPWPVGAEAPTRARRPG